MNPDRPTAYIRMADAGDLYITWRWSDGTGPGGVGIVPEDQVRQAVSRTTAALPDPSRPGGLESALRTGELARYDAENDLAQFLSRVFLPYRLAVDLHGLHTRGVRPHLRIQPAPRVAHIPWELLAPDPALRLLDLADLSRLAPIALTATRTPRRWADTRHLPIVAVLDPRVPGFRADSPLGSVLGRMTAPTPLLERVERYSRADRLRPRVAEPADAFRRTDIDRDWLGRTLRAGASRLLYVGHVTAAAPESGRAEQARLHLACTADTVGRAEPIRDHRPLSALDLILGTDLDGPERWPIPARVALIACESGGDQRFGEPLGLVAAMIHGGAELVTASRWTLPTDLAHQRFGGTDAHPLREAICAIDAAHERPDPVHALNAWQRERLNAWRATGSPADTPLSWAAFTTIDAAGPAPQCSS